jgi:uncharacterized membrane protein (Fun14 family)
MNNANEVGNSQLPYMELGGGFVFGLFLGFLFKTFRKNLQTVLMVLTFIALLMMFFDYLGYININEIKMENLLNTFSHKIEHFWVMAKDKFEHYQFEGGMSVFAGFLVGSNFVTPKPVKK